MSDIEFKFKPCYPRGTTLEQQLNKIKSEFEEVLSADNWEDEAKEILDVVQTIVGYRKLAGFIESEEIFVTNLELVSYIFKEQHLLEEKNHFFRSIKQLEDKCGKDSVSMNVIFDLLDMFLDLISKHDRGNEKYRKELLERFVDEHNEKIEQVRQQMKDGTYPKQEEI